MKNELSISRDIPWGEDLIRIRSRGGELAKQVESRILAKYLLLIRNKLETDGQLNRIVASSKPASAAAPKVTVLLREFIELETEDLFEQAVIIILDELEQLRTKDPSLYLVNAETGMVSMPIPKELTRDLVYTPPDYLGEDNQWHKAHPMLHPGIAASIVLATQDNFRLQKALKGINEPLIKQAYDHLSSPERIVEMAKEKLLHIGMVSDDTINVPETQILFGYENAEDIFQSPNTRFSRIHLLSSVLARKIRGLGSNRFSISKISVKKSAKQKWYVVQARVN